jgi:hypothetical protein
VQQITIVRQMKMMEVANIRQLYMAVQTQVQQTIINMQQLITDLVHTQAHRPVK